MSKEDNTSKKSLLIDSDGGVDDALALALAARIDGFRPNVLVATHGNVPVARALQNIKLIAGLANTRPSLHIGASGPLAGTSKSAEHAHGDDGLWGATTLANNVGDLPTAPHTGEDAISSFLRGPEAEKYYLGIGPATTLARALAQGGSPAVKGARLFLMAGAVRIPGNITPFAEFNSYADPEALGAVLSAGLPVTMIGLDVCTKVVLTPEVLERFSKSDRQPLGAVLAKALDGYMAFYKKVANVDGCYPHDAIALAAVVWPDIFEFEQLSIKVIRDGEQRGKTAIDPAGQRVRVAVNIDAHAFKKRMFEALNV